MKKGFTLIELLLASAMSAVIGLAVYSTFYMGMSVWRRAGAVSLQDKKRLIRVERLRKDLRQTFVFRGDEIPFEGTNTTVSFPAIVNSSVVRLVYSFDPKNRAVRRGVQGLPEIIAAKTKEEKPAPSWAPFLEGVDDARVAYFSFDPAKGAYRWKGSWEEKDSLPRAVRFTITFPGNETFNETVFVPAG